MKEWIRPELEPLEISETMYGGTPADEVDLAWEDTNGEIKFGYGS